jgi:hypothetical protein
LHWQAAIRRRRCRLVPMWQRHWTDDARTLLRAGGGTLC